MFEIENIGDEDANYFVAYLGTEVLAEGRDRSKVERAANEILNRINQGELHAVAIGV